MWDYDAIYGCATILWCTQTHTVHFSVTHFPMLTIANISKLCTYLGRFITAIHDECAPIRCIRLQTFEY